MDKKVTIAAIENYVYNKLINEGSGHDWWHIDRVRKNALKIGKLEHANLFTVELAALLHDLIDDKLAEEIKISPDDVRSLLKKQFVYDSVIDEVLSIIQKISFRSNISREFLSLEGMVVQDADRLDAIGAIGIARTFAYSGSRGQLIYNPSNKHGKDAIQHFYEKLLKLKDLMNTDTGKMLANKRHEFMELYLEEFYHEWGSNE
ncbi:HD domain-containing protein [Metabacillus litoralis]|uniref:HD domain-containing protein n=1 Tax=Metabacillus litoralis TaxID=152268 RepID=UPI001CFD1846|nr:HD domain-containing protein [Metabacillus litoralis]